MKGKRWNISCIGYWKDIWYGKSLIIIYFPSLYQFVSFPEVHVKDCFDLLGNQLNGISPSVGIFWIMRLLSSFAFIGLWTASALLFSSSTRNQISLGFSPSNPLIGVPTGFSSRWLTLPFGFLFSSPHDWLNLCCWVRRDCHWG